jgi:hypothetical protein
MNFKQVIENAATIAVNMEIIGIAIEKMNRPKTILLRKPHL